MWATMLAESKVRHMLGPPWLVAFALRHVVVAAHMTSPRGLQTRSRRLGLCRIQSANTCKGVRWGDAGFHHRPEHRGHHIQVSYWPRCGRVCANGSSRRRHVQRRGCYAHKRQRHSRSHWRPDRYDAQVDGSGCQRSVQGVLRCSRRCLQGLLSNAWHHRHLWTAR